MKKLQRSINTEFSDLTTSIGNDIGLLRSAVDESSASVKELKEAIYNNENNIRLLKESAEKELNNLNEKIYEVNEKVESLYRWHILINDKLANEYVLLSAFKNKTKSQDKIADYLMWAVITEAFAILGLIFYLCLTKVI
jgi:hypothetical protein